MAAHRYWRIAITANNGHTYTCLMTVRFFNTSIVDEIAISGGTASASTIYSATYSADKALDGDQTTGWNNNADMPCWWQYDFGAGNEKTIAGVGMQAVYIASGFVPAVAPKDFSLQWSDDGFAWTSLFALTNQVSWGNTEFRLFWSTQPARVLNEIARVDIADGGNYRIYGTAKRLGAFTQRQVCLLDRQTKRVLRQTLSDPIDGSYSFDYIAYRYRGYIVMELDWPPDRSDPLNAAVADLQTPALMP